MKWSHPIHSRKIVIRPDDQRTSPLTGWMSFHDPWMAGRRKKPPPSSLSSGRLSAEVGGPTTRRSHHFIPGGIVGSSLSSSSSQCPLSDCWDFACRSLAFATTNIKSISPNATPVLVHRCAAIAGHCPVSLLEWIVAHSHAGYDDDDDDDDDDNNAGRWWFTGDACAATADDLGRLPLHRALEAADDASSSSSSSAFEEDVARDDDGDDGDCHYGAEDGESGAIPATVARPPHDKADASATVEVVRPRAAAGASSSSSYGDPRLQRNRTRIVDALLRWPPGAAAMPFPDGRSPLVHAVARGGSWHTSDFRNGNNAGLLQLLWTRSPERSVEVDPVSGLYPFMLAATVPVGRHSRNALEVVENVYNLLRKDPQLVSCATLFTNDVD